MTISIGLIPNEKTVMLMQDSEISYKSLGFTQDIYKKIKQLDNSSVTGVIGNPLVGNEIIEIVQIRNYETAKSLIDIVEDAYHRIREEKIQRGVLRKYGFNNIREVTQPQTGTQIDPEAKQEILNAINNRNGYFALDLMLAINKEKPLLYTISFPGAGTLENNVKGYTVSGSGSIMAIEKMGVELENYRWQKELSIDEGIDILLRAGKASEKHEGVGGPFEIAYITEKEGKTEITNPDQKKINMIMYLYPLKIKEEIMIESIKKMRDGQIKAEELANYIKTNTKVGIEFDEYFGLNK